MSKLFFLWLFLVSTLFLACGAQVHNQVSRASEEESSPPGQGASEALEPGQKYPPPEAAGAEPVATKAAPLAASGTVKLGQKVLHIKSAVAVWDTKNQQLNVYLYPFDLAPADIEKARTMGDIFVAMGKPSPNPEFWPTWSPWATVRFALPPDTTTITPNRIKSMGVALGWLREKNSSFSSHAPAVNVDPGAIDGSIAPGATVKLRVKGEIGAANHVATYDLTATCKVLHCGPPRCP